ncbi:tail fiber assembly protein [Serratia fonticola]|uniref:tail fiber assembly protein n=1 Tax=Serratia fonticola TaxID=47917 RepID=UPI00093B7FD6|nr:tail fiber assembly protein [Serratia fonticola]OKP28435.1 hypothetical protein BSQ40_12260 [Serratia fonticola]
MATVTHVYSASLARFYAVSLKDTLEASGEWPDDTKPVTYATVLAFQVSETPDGMQLSADDEGLPCWAPLFDEENRLLRAELERKAYQRIASDTISRLQPVTASKARMALPDPGLVTWLDYLARLDSLDLTVAPILWPEMP